jgi:outer membrane murein-binding lipoprotein Lpp
MGRSGDDAASHRHGRSVGRRDQTIVWRRVVGLGVLAVVGLAGCSSDEESACERLNDRLDSIEAEVDALPREQTWENVVRVQELAAERDSVRRNMVRDGCAVGT